MEVQLNTLYVVTQGACLRRDHLTVKVVVEKQTRLVVPIHHLDSVAVFGNVHVSPGLLSLCAENGVAVTFLTESGRLLSRVDAPGSGNVLLRRTQFRWADLPDCCVGVARAIVAGKLHNSRNLLLRAGRETDAPDDQAALQTAAGQLAEAIRVLPAASNTDAVRGHEAMAHGFTLERFRA
jgi:CRISPR-associated protein Cas1